MMTFVIQTFSAPLLVLDYYRNTNAYAKNCINKTRPVMHCNGKCQVMKKLKEEERKEKQSQERKPGNTETFFTKSFYYDIMFIAVHLEKPLTREFNINFTIHPRDFFHPPQS
jgi:hypothetical protein